MEIISHSFDNRSAFDFGCRRRWQNIRQWRKWWRVGNRWSPIWYARYGNGYGNGNEPDDESNDDESNDDEPHDDEPDAAIFKLQSTRISNEFQ